MYSTMRNEIRQKRVAMKRKEENEEDLIVRMSENISHQLCVERNIRSLSQEFKGNFLLQRISKDAIVIMSSDVQH